MELHQHDPPHARAISLVIVGAVASIAGLVGLTTIGFWYAADMGWTGSGSTIVESRSPIIAAILVPAAALVVGVSVVLLRGSVAARSPRGVVIMIACLLVTASVSIAVSAYPQVEQAKLVAMGDDGTVRWRTDLPVTRVFGMRYETDTTVTLEGSADRRGCDWQLRSVTIDRATGEILDVHALPTFYGDPSQVPPPPTPIEPEAGGLDVEQGSAPFVCHS